MSVVYFITAREFNRVKIGFTAGDPKIRRNKIKADCPTPVVLEAVVAGGREEEATFHRQFAEHRVCGEWFSITAGIEQVILANKIPSPPLKRYLPANDVHPTSAALAEEMLAFCSCHDLTITDFSRQAANDKSFLASILTRRRRIWPETEAKVRRFMATYKPDAEADAA